MRTHLLNTLLIAGIAGLSFASSTASASVMFIPGNNPQPGEQNVLFITGTGTTVSGMTNMSNTLVNFSSSTGQTLITNSSGQAKITTEDNGGLITSINVSSPGNTFTDFIGNPEHSGAFTVTVKTNDGTFTDNFARRARREFRDNPCSRQRDNLFRRLHVLCGLWLVRPAAHLRHRRGGSRTVYLGDDVARLRWSRLRVPPVTTQGVDGVTNEIIRG